MDKNLEIVQKRITQLADEINYHNYLYHVLDKPTIPDEVYDDLMKELRRLENQYPQFKSSTSPTQKVGGGALDGFKKIKHQKKMLSLDDVKTKDDFLS